jgi:competence protein ComEC
MADGLSDSPLADQPPAVRTPLVPLAAALTAGIVAGRHVPIDTTAWAVWACIAGAAAAGLALRRFVRLAGLTLMLAVIALGAIHFRIAWYRLPKDHIVTYAGPARTIASIRGRVADSPATHASAVEAGYSRAPVTSFDLSAEEILVAGRWRPVRGVAQVTVLEADNRLARGQRVELAGWLSRVSPADNPGQRDPGELARLTGRLVRFRVPASAAATVLAETSGSPLQRVRDGAGRWARQRLAGLGESRGELVLEALVLGRRDPSLLGLQDSMARVGVAHLLSISGMHLGIFLGFIYLLCRVSTLGRRQAAAVALACLAGYLLLAEPRSPLLRSAIMAAALCVGAIVHRPGSSLNALALAAVVLLIADPADLFQPGFQLSFATVAGLILFQRPMRELLFGRFLRVRGLRVYRDEQRLRRWLAHTGADMAIGAVTISILAWLVSVPLAAYHFSAVSACGAPLTLAIAPLVTVALVLGYLGLALAWAPNLSHTLCSAGAGVAETMARVVEAAASLSGLSADLRPVGPLWVLAAYAAIVLVIIHRRLWLGRLWAAGAVACLVGATVFTQWPAGAPDVAELHVLDVGAGNCIVLRAPGGRTAVFDAGSLGRSDAGREVLLPFIRHERLPMPAMAAVSHANSDHFNALPALVDGGGAREVYLNDYFGRIGDPASGPEALDLMARFARCGSTVHRVKPGEIIHLDERTDVEVLWPPPGRGEMEVNDRSLVFRVRCDGRTVLLPGDISDVAQAALAARPEKVRADVLVLPHHGNWRATLPAFVAAVAPKVIVVSSPDLPAATLKGGTPAKEFYGSLPNKYRYYVTAMNGYIRVRFGRGDVTVTTWR